MNTKSQAQTLVSFHWEGIKERRQSERFLHLNKHLHPTHYINNMTFTIYSHKRFVLKEELFQWECFFSWFLFCHGRIIVIVSAFVLFIIINIIVLLVGWRIVVMRLRLWLVVLALLWTEKRTLQLKMLWLIGVTLTKFDLLYVIVQDLSILIMSFQHGSKNLCWCSVSLWPAEGSTSPNKSRARREHIPARSQTPSTPPANTIVNK